MTINALPRRAVITGIAAAGALSVAADGVAAAFQIKGHPSLAITVDDFRFFEGPLSPDACNSAILRALDKHGLRACAFPAGKFVDSPEGRRRVAMWADRGHAIGCHGYAHAYYSGKDPAAFAIDLDQALPIVRPYPTSVPLFRFPFLAEGNTAQARDAARVALAQRGLVNGHVTIDTSDWYIANRLTERLKREPKTDLAPYRRFYLAHLIDRANYYDQLARDAIGRTVPHTILLHHNLTTALFLDDALAMFRSRGWALRHASAAFSDPVFKHQPMIAPAGQSLIWQFAKETGRFEKLLRYPGEDDSYEQPTMDRLGL